MPRVAHGDEHHVVVIAEVPLRPVRRVEHKTDLRRQRGVKKKKKKSAMKFCTLAVLPPRTSFPAGW